MPREPRITLILRAETNPAIDWNHGRSADLRMVFLGSMEALRFAIGRATCDDSALDVERIVIDRAVSAHEFLDFLTVVPSLFLGDVVFVGEEGTGFLSATARGCGRLLYRLSRHDIRFYLETHQLVTGRTAPIAFEARA